VSRAAQAVFGALVAATVAAFFVTQHLKSTTPVLTGDPHPSPGAISPGNTACGGLYERTRLSFYLLHRADDVSVYVVDESGSIVRTLAAGRHMRRGVRHPDGEFTWNGREDSGRLAPDGTYNFRVVLIHQNRSIELKTPVVVKTVAPHPSVARVTVSGSTPALLPGPGGARARIDYGGAQGHVARVLVYRTDSGRPRLVGSFLSRSSPAYWDGRVHGGPAAPGTYLIGLSVTDRACNTGTFPPLIPPTPGSTGHAGVTVRYLAAAPQLDPAPGGGAATVLVDSRRRPYTWALRRLGVVGHRGRPVLRHGAGGGPSLHVPLPAGAGLYELALRCGGNRTVVPLVARTSPPRYGRILVVLPALTWQGQGVGDEDGDGLPDTLDAGGPVVLSRPLAGGLPAGFADEAELLAYLDRARLPYDLTTDLGLIDGVGPGLYGHPAAVLLGSERWMPPSLSGPLLAYVRSGHRLLSVGVDSLRRTVEISSAGGVVEAVSPGHPSVVDTFGATSGPFVSSAPGVILGGDDGLGIFNGTSGAFPGFSAYQPVTGTVPPAGKVLSAAGPSTGSAAIAGWRFGHGVVVEIGIAGFGSGLSGSVDAQELVRRLWTVLAR
jgi:hypothetical protein